jgi:hypothetical protein
MIALHGKKLYLYWIVSAILVHALQSPGLGDLSKRPAIPQKTIERSEPMAAYVIEKTFDTSEESFREFEPRYRSSAKGEDALARIADFANAEGLYARVEQGDSKTLLQEMKQNTSIILVVTKAGYLAFCHPTTASTNMIVTTTFRGMEPIEWNDWDGRFLVAQHHEPVKTSGNVKVLLAVALSLVVVILILSSYVIRKRK